MKRKKGPWLNTEEDVQRTGQKRRTCKGFSEKELLNKC